MNYLCPACRRSVAVAAGAVELRCPGCTLVAPLSKVGTAPGVALPVALDRAGTTVGGYALAERIGAGGMGTVYRATAPDGATVAVKLLHPEASRGELTERLRREGEALRRLIHPRVVRLIDLGEADGIPYLVTELVAGQDLAAVLAARTLGVAEAAAIVIQVCEGVGAAHVVGIVHRDLKPANVLLDSAGAAKVVDFGLAQLAGDVTALTRTDVALGTINYLAPEQRRSARTVDARADVYALGVMFYEMITGELPLGRFPLPSERGLPRRCDAIIEHTLASDPARRYDAVAALATALRPLAAPLTAPRRRARLLALAAAGLALTGVASAAGLGAFTAAPGAPTPSPVDGAPTPLPVDGAPTPSPPDAVPDAAPDAAPDGAPTPRVVDAAPRPRTRTLGKRPARKPGR